MDEYDALLNEADTYLNPKIDEEQANMQGKRTDGIDSNLLYKSDLTKESDE